jgi:hypothetical protein
LNDTSSSTKSVLRNKVWKTLGGVWFPWSGWVFSRPDSPKSHPLPSLWIPLCPLGVGVWFLWSGWVSLGCVEDLRGLE